MSSASYSFELPRNIERYVAALSKLYGQDGQRLKQEILVNAQIRVHEEWSRDNWNGGTYGHALFLEVPESIFLSCVRNKDELQTEICSELNKLHNVPNEFIEEVFLEAELDIDKDWRQESGVLLSTKVSAPQAAIDRIWGDGGYRVFLSHKAEVKKETSALKDRLKGFGVSCFVAHEDIQPSREWQDEIENALASMDALVALMTENFHDSNWTDQEIGYAFGRGVPIIPVRLGRDPYGFIGKFQALSCTWEQAALEIAKLLIRHDRMLASFISTAKLCKSFDHGNQLAVLLPFIERMTERQALELVDAYNENFELRGSFGFNGGKQKDYGQGLVFHLQRLTGKSYIQSSGRIDISP